VCPTVTTSNRPLRPSALTASRSPTTGTSATASPSPVGVQTPVTSKPCSGRRRVRAISAASARRLLIALMVVPLVVAVFVRTRREAVGMARAFVVGAVVNAVISLMDKVGVSAVSATLHGSPTSTAARPT
jgi:hypothetical protein